METCNILTAILCGQHKVFLKENYPIPNLLKENNGNKICLVILM